MNKTRTIILPFLLTLACAVASAQEQTSDNKKDYKPYPYYFFQLQGGVNKVFSPGSKLYPTGSFGFGGMFTPVLGARLHFNGYETKNGFADNDNTYKFRYITSDVDLMLNIVNIFSRKRSHAIDLYLIGGVGMSYAWNRSDYGRLVGPTEDVVSHNLRAGLLIDANVSKHWSIGLEGNVNALEDRFNSKLNGCMDWLFTGQLSVTYKFGFKQKAAPPVAAPVTTERNYNATAKDANLTAAATRPVQATETAKAVEKAPAPVVVPVNETMFYRIRETGVADKEAVISKVADWCRQNPAKTVCVQGYADKGTGTAEVNERYARLRAENVAKALKAKGVPESQIQVVSHGDTVQPYSENDKNRCVIIVGK